MATEAHHGGHEEINQSMARVAGAELHNDGEYVEGSASIPPQQKNVGRDVPKKLG